MEMASTRLDAAGATSWRAPRLQCIPIFVDDEPEPENSTSSLMEGDDEDVDDEATPIINDDRGWNGVEVMSYARASALP